MFLIFEKPFSRRLKSKNTSVPKNVMNNSKNNKHHPPSKDSNPRGDEKVPRNFGDEYNNNNENKWKSWNINDE